MCAICGSLDFHTPEMDPVLIRDMTSTMRHRGPDRNDIFISGPLGLGHARLSIIDVSALGNQPMSTADGRYTISFNGEIYNFKEIRAELDAFQYPFKGNSDTEVLLYAFAHWGTKVFRRCNGIFAVAIWDNLKQELTLCRDRFGVKPLYFVRTRGGVTFASEIKALISAGVVDAKLHESAFHEFLYFGNPLGRNTMFEGVSALLPGHLLVCSRSKFSEECYWRPEDVPNQTDSFDTAILRTRELLESAVRRQLVADVPVGVFLSGGIDSSCVTAFARKHYPGTLKTYSVGFDFDKGVNELPKARRIAAHFGTEHSELYIAGGNLIDTIESLVVHHDAPFSDAANIPLYLLCKQLAGSPKVVLQGDGGDEIFAGYSRYILLSFLKFWKTASKIKSLLNLVLTKRSRLRLNRILDGLGTKDEAKRMALLLTLETRSDPPELHLSPEWRKRLQSSDPFARYREMNTRFASLDHVQRMLYTDVSIILPDTFLEKVDKSTMAFGIEARVPMLDHELTDYVMGLPSSYKVKRGQKKWLLRSALRNLVPNEVLDGPKTGFGVPYGFWLKGPLAQYTRERLLSGHRDGPFAKEALNKLISEHQKGERNHAFILWKILNFTIWQEYYNVS